MQQKKIIKWGFLLSFTVLALILLPCLKSKAETTVCKIGNTTYTSLEEAFEALSNKTGTITMTADYEMKYCIHMIEYSSAPNNTNITLDLAGHAVNYPDSEEYTSLVVYYGAKLRLKDSVGGGSYSSGNDDCGMITVYGGTFVMDSGIIKENKNPGINETGIYIAWGNVIINGGEIHARFPFQSYVSYYGPIELTINNGKFIGVTNSVIGAGVKARINGGIFDCSNNDYDNARGITIISGKDIKDDIQITGGEFHGKAAGIYLCRAVEFNKYTLDNYKSKLIPYGYQLYSLTKPNTVATATADSDSIYVENHVVVRGIQSTLFFQTNGGTVSKKSIPIIYGKCYGALPAPTRIGYRFLGWYTSLTGGIKVTANTKVNTAKSQTVYAHWEKIKATVLFSANGGKKLSKKSTILTYGSKFGTLPTVIRSKYIFVGWYTNKVGGTKVTASTISKFSKNTTLYAHWTRVSVKKTSITSLSSKSRKAYITYKKVSKAKSYEIIVATNSKFTKGVKKYTVASTKKTLSDLKKWKRYYFRVRAYQYDSTKSKVYGDWSKIKSIKIK